MRSNLSFVNEQALSQKFSHYFKSTFFSLLQSLEELGLVLNFLRITLLSLYDVSHIKSAFPTLLLSSQAVLMEGMATHKVNRGKSQSILTVRTVIGQEGLGCGFQLFKLRSALFCFLEIFLDYLSVFFYIVTIFF
jgi:hypothetical protein